MPNMSYCRFENTASDLRDVVDNWDSIDAENDGREDYESRAKRAIIELAREIVAMEDAGEES